MGEGVRLPDGLKDEFCNRHTMIVLFPFCPIAVPDEWTAVDQEEARNIAHGYLYIAHQRKLLPKSWIVPGY